jgi:RNA-directed DNA polymerase
MIGGLEEATEEGTPQGGPLSPLLSNIVLDELDKELEKRGLRFVRYADDCVILVKSKTAARRVIRSITTFITRRLRLKVNEEKSGVRRPWEVKFLGMTLNNRRTKPAILLHWKSVERMKQKVREITSRSRGRSLAQVIVELNEYLRGWWQYFGITESMYRLSRIDSWIRRRLRSIVWKQWRNRRTRVRNLAKLGIGKDAALKTGCARKGCWRMSQVKWVMIALPNLYFRRRGLIIPWV